jgi:hypothetical protein
VRVPAVGTLGVDALRTDLYVESLLVGAGMRSPAVPGDPAPDPAAASAARVLSSSVGRPHPSFRFEERLSRRLAEIALGMIRAAAAGGGAPLVMSDPGPWRTGGSAAGAGGRPAGELVAFPGPAAMAAHDAAPGALGRTDPRPALAGGAVASAAFASAALSIGAAAVVAWRLTHVRRGIV